MPWQSRWGCGEGFVSPHIPSTEIASSLALLAKTVEVGRVCFVEFTEGGGRHGAGLKPCATCPFSQSSPHVAQPFKAARGWIWARLRMTEGEGLAKTKQQPVVDFLPIFRYSVANRINVVGCPRVTEGLIGKQTGGIPVQSRLL